MLTKYDHYKIAGEAKCDPRVVRTYLEGTKQTRDAVANAIDAAIELLGYQSNEVRK
jgi:hypothetical protein